jgi:hypothetical protein
LATDELLCDKNAGARASIMFKKINMNIKDRKNPGGHLRFASYSSGFLRRPQKLTKLNLGFAIS